MNETPQHVVDPATLAPGTPVEVASADCTARSVVYAYPHGWAGDDTGDFEPWDGERIVRVLGDVTPWPVIAPEDMKPDMRLRAVHEDGTIIEARVDRVTPRYVVLDLPTAMHSLDSHFGWTLHVHPDDAPAPDPDPDADPDAALVEAMARAMVEEVVTHEPEPWERATATTQERFRKRARAALAAVRAHDAKAGESRG